MRFIIVFAAVTMLSAGVSASKCRPSSVRPSVSSPSISISASPSLPSSSPSPSPSSVSSAVQPICSSTNHITNGDFSNGLSGYVFTSSGVPGADWNVVTDCDGGSSGNFAHCLQVNYDGTNGQNLELTQTVPTTSGTTYEIGVIYRLLQIDPGSDGTSQSQSMVFDCYIGTTRIIHELYAVGQESSPWTVLSTPLTVPSSSTQLVCYIGPTSAVVTFQVAFFYIGANCGPN